MASITVDIWSDIACPWCYIGKRRFEKALERFDGDVEITFHSFEIAPDTPADFSGSEVDFLVSHKGMAPEQVQAMLAQVTAVAADEGLDYDFDNLKHANTNLAHQLLHFAKTQGKQPEMKQALLSAYFEQGRRLGTIDDLVALATEMGLDGEGGREQPLKRVSLRQRCKTTFLKLASMESRQFRSSFSTINTGCPARSPLAR